MTALIIILIIAVGALALTAKYYKDQAQKSSDEYIKEYLAQYTEEVQKIHQETQQKIKEEYEELARQKELINTQIDLLTDQLARQRQKQIETYNLGMETFNQQAQDQKQKIQFQLDSINKDLNDARAKQEVINQEIRHRKELEEQQNFCRIVLSDSDQQDISYLISIIPNLRNQEILYKLIWSEYIQKAFNKMLKNILGSKDPKNVIYIITNINTKQVYIGKTKAEISKRWTEHIKTSLNIGTTKKSLIHEALYNHWNDFTFAILERVPNDVDLGAREKYWIDFYQSNIYGYNIKNGG